MTAISTVIGFDFPALTMSFVWGLMIGMIVGATLSSLMFWLCQRRGMGAKIVTPAPSDDASSKIEKDPKSLSGERLLKKKAKSPQVPMGDLIPCCKMQHDLRVGANGSTRFLTCRTCWHHITYQAEAELCGELRLAIQQQQDMLFY